MLSSVDLNAWSFRFSNSSSMLEQLSTAKADTELTFSTAVDLLLHSANDGTDDARIQTRVHKRLRRDVVVKSWRNQQTLLKNLRHFPRYRGKAYDHYHEAARAGAAGRATPRQLALADGLKAEIDASRLIVPVGQILFHGRANQDLTATSDYPTFISTSLDPIVARNSAFRRAGLNQAYGRPVVFVLTLRIPLPALWGHVGRSCEWELLLPPSLGLRQTGIHSGGGFDVVEAEVLRRA